MHRFRFLPLLPARRLPLSAAIGFATSVVAIAASAGPAGNLVRGTPAQGATNATGGVHSLRGTVGSALVGHPDSLVQVGLGFWYAVRGAGLVAVEPLPEPPAFVFRLDQNSPNPVVGTTHFSFEVPRESAVALSIYDVRGRRVARLVDRVMPAGKYRIAFQPRELASGSYYYELRAGEHVATKRLVVLH